MHLSVIWLHRERMNKMFCQKCGNVLQNGEKFCRVCGNPVMQTAQTSLVNNSASTVIENKPSVKPKKQINKKVLIPSIIGALVLIAILVIGIVSISAYIENKPIREMEKAFESKDINQVISVIEKCEDGDYYKCNSSEKVRGTLWSNINSATDTFNSEFVYDNQTYDKNDILEAVIEFMENRFGTLYYINGDKSDIWHLEEYMKSANLKSSYGGSSADGTEIFSTDVLGALNDLDSLIASRIAYYDGMKCLNNPNDSEDYWNAIEKFSAVIKSDLKYNDAVAKSSEAFDLYFKGTMEAVDKYIASGDYSAAVQLLNNTVDGVSNSKEYSEAIAAKADEILKTYASQYAQKAEEYFRAGDVNTAIGNIEAAIQIDPNGGYEAKLNEYKLYLPLALYDMNNVLSQSSDYRIKKESSLNSVNNKEYNNCLLYRHYQDCSPSTISYLLEGKYDTVSGVYFSPKENASMNRTGTAYFEVYGDGKLIYTSQTISAESLPTEVDFSVSGVQKLEIKFIGKGSSVWGMDAQWYGDYAALSDLTARKNIPQ